MSPTNEVNIFNKDALKSILLAIFFVAAISGFLSWQYNRIADQSEEKLSSLEDVVEQSLAQDVLDKFMMARINKNESQALLFLTERAMVEKEGGLFDLLGGFSSYRVAGGKELEENQFQFKIELYEEEKSEGIEVIKLIKILNQYYIDSVILAG